MLAQALSVVPRAILAAAIRVANQTRLGMASAQRLIQRLTNRALAQVIGHRVADDPAAVEVFDPGQIQPAFGGGHAGDVADPRLIGTLDSKALSQPIRGHGPGMARIRRHAKPPFLSAAQAQLAADAPDAMKADANAVRRQITLQALGPVGLAASLVRGANLSPQSALLAASRRGWSPPPGMKPAA